MKMVEEEKKETKPKKRIITLDLLRKRSEHNEGLVSSLEELALHQEEIQSIGPLLGRTCGKTLKILLLQNNVIDTMDHAELKLFRSLEYLNLALNNINKIQGIRGMEWLKKLDLTLNFINVDALEESVNELSGCRSLEELYLLGNPCMGLDNESALQQQQIPMEKRQVGWKGCRAYIIARLPNLQFLDGMEIKRSERILAMQQLPSLASELQLLARSRQKELGQLEHETVLVQNSDVIDESYIGDDEPTQHNPETRTKLSNEMHDQKQGREKQEKENQPPKLKGEKEWEEEHIDTVQMVREREEKGRERESSNGNDDSAEVNATNLTKKDGGIKQCNQGKYQFWFEEEDNAKNNGAEEKKRSGGNTLIMRIAIPKHLSTSLIDVDIHPTYVSVVIKSKILRVILPVEVMSTQSSARRSAATGYLELVMPKVNPNEVLIGLGHVRDNTGKDRKVDNNKKVSDAGSENKTRMKKERLGQILMKEAGLVDSLKIVPNEVSEDSGSALNIISDDDDDDEPPPLF